MNEDHILDETSQKIVQTLRANPRIENRALAAEVGVSAPTLYSRLDSLKTEKVCEVRAQQDFFALGYDRFAFIDVGVRDRSLKDVADDIAQFDTALAVLEFVESPRLLVPVLAPDDRSLLELLRERLAKVVGVASLVTSIITQVHRYSPDFGEIGVDRHTRLPALHLDDRLDDVDKEILESLRLHARISIRELSVKVGKSESSVRRRLEKLQNSAVLRFNLVAAPAYLGFDVWGHLRLSCAPTPSKKLLDYLKNAPESICLCETTGKENVHFWGVFQNDGHLAEFIDTIYGLQKNAVSISARKVYQVHKHNCDYGRIVQ